MATVNKVFLIGNLTRDPELRYTPNGSAVCEFGIAINRVFTSNNERKEETCFVDVNAWGRQAETCAKYLKKGAPVCIEGRLHLDRWEDKETGRPRSKLKVVAERTQFLGSPPRHDDRPGPGNERSGYANGGQQQHTDNNHYDNGQASSYHQHASPMGVSPQAQETPNAVPPPPASPPMGNTPPPLVDAPPGGN